MMKTILSKIRKPVSLILVMALFVMALSACAGSGSTDRSSFLIVVDRTGGKLVSVKYTITSSDTSSKVNELMKALQNYSGATYSSPIMAGSLVSWEYEDSVVSVYFNSEYNEMTVVDEAMARAAVVKTLCQLQDVKSVYFYVDDAELTIKGSLVGAMDDSSFIDDINMNEGNTTLKLYFPNSDKTKLTMIEREVAYNPTFTDEQLIIEELLKGPQKGEGNISDAYPGGTRLLSVVTRDKVCYVNLSGDFLQYLEDVPAELTVYSLVNTLTGLSAISSVVIMVDGNNLDMYNNFNCNILLTFNYDYVEVNE